MRLTVDSDRCQGHALCGYHAPELIGLTEEEGHAYVLLENVPPELEDTARKAVMACPEEAISVHDD